MWRNSVKYFWIVSQVLFGLCGNKLEKKKDNMEAYNVYCSINGNSTINCARILMYASPEEPYKKELKNSTGVVQNSHFYNITAVFGDCC